MNIIKISFFAILFTTTLNILSCGQRFSKPIKDDTDENDLNRLITFISLEMGKELGNKKSKFHINNDIKKNKDTKLNIAKQKLGKLFNENSDSIILLQDLNIEQKN